MGFSSWDSMLYSKEEFSALYKKTNGFNETLRSSSPLRPEGMSFAQFVSQGSDLLIVENPEICSVVV